MADESHKAAAAESRAEASARETQEVMTLFNRRLHRLAERDLGCAIIEPMPEASESLRRGFNQSVSQLQEALGGATIKARAFEGEGHEAATADLSNHSERQDHRAARRHERLPAGPVASRRAGDGEASNPRVRSVGPESETHWAWGPDLLACG
ncbi:methyl-accepting chemotaxis protein [Citreicella sp. SE45]|nr:methyl-accepting chemotaxis protein [Citreicella sp. SE45]